MCRSYSFTSIFGNPLYIVNIRYVKIVVTAIMQTLIKYVQKCPISFDNPFKSPSLEIEYPRKFTTISYTEFNKKKQKYKSNNK